MVDGETRRILKYTMPINNPMIKAKDTEVTETHQLCQEKPYLYVYVISPVALLAGYFSLLACK